MKKVSALILSIVYLAFMTGVLSDVPARNTVAFDESASTCEFKQAGEKDSFEENHQIRKILAHHHMAHAGKIKIPRPLVTSPGLLSFSPLTFNTSHASIIATDPSPGLCHPLYLANRVLLI